MSFGIVRKLEETFGGIPPDIKDNLKYLTINSTNNTELRCLPCNKVVKTVQNQNVTSKNFRAHIFSKLHKNISFSVEDVFKALEHTFYGKIPRLVLNNIFVLDIYGVDYKCFICNKVLKVKSSRSSTERSFSYHLLSANHIQQWVEYKVMEGKLTFIFGEIPYEVINNIKVIGLTRSGKNYVCNVCNALLIVDASNDQLTVDRFKEHFNSAEHYRNTTLSKVFLLIPEMQTLDSKVPTYLSRNIDYITTSEADLFCKLCDEIIRRDQMDIAITEQNLKLHILSSNHEKNVFSRIDNIKEYSQIHNVFGEFSTIILGNLRYLRLTDKGFSCSICKEGLPRSGNFWEVKGNIIRHINSYLHINNFSEEMQRQNCLVNSLKAVFGGFPPMIEENISFLEFKGGSNFQCTLCEATLQAKKINNGTEFTAMITQENFEKHLSTNKHFEAQESTYHSSVLVKTKLKDLFHPIPLFIIQNLDIIQYNGVEGNFFCVLCYQDILIDYGNKTEEITLQNFRNHIFSNIHTYNLKIRSRRKIGTVEKLENIFGRIPNCILSNIEHLYEDKHSFFCYACDVEIRLGSFSEASEQNFFQHLLGSHHKLSIENIELSVDRAFHYLDTYFCMPEFLLKEIDFFRSFHDSLYCNLCQEVFFIEYDDLKKTRQSLKSHVNCERHKINLE